MVHAPRQASTHAPRARGNLAFRGLREIRTRRDGPVGRHRREDTHRKVLERERRHLLAPLPGLIFRGRRERTEGIKRLGRRPDRFELPPGYFS